MSSTPRGFAALSIIAFMGLSVAAMAPVSAQNPAGTPRVVGTKIADGQAYAPWWC